MEFYYKVMCLSFAALLLSLSCVALTVCIFAYRPPQDNITICAADLFPETDETYTATIH